MGGTSDRRALEEAVAASERVRALVYLAVEDVIFSLAVEGERFRFLEINPAFTRATGLGEDQVVGKMVDEVIPEPSLSLVLAKYRQAISERRTVRWEETTEYPMGTRHGEVSVTPVLDADGRCSRLIGTVHDVTDVRQAEEMIRLYADIAGAVQIGLTMWHVLARDDPETVTLVAANSAADRATGIELTRRIGDSLPDLLPSGTGPEMVELICRIAREGRAGQLTTWEFVETLGRRRSFALKGFPLSGDRVGLAIEDVTEQTRAEALRTTERRALEMVASGSSLEDTLRELALAMEDIAPPARASVLLLSEDGEAVDRLIAPHLPEKLAVGMVGCPSSAWIGEGEARTAIGPSSNVTPLDDISAWEEHRDLADELGLGVCWSTPVRASDGRPLGIFALYAPAGREPTPSDVELLGRATHVAGIAVQRHQLDERQRELAARLEAAREEERRGIAREIHDQLGQGLTAIKLDVAWIARHAGPSGLDVPPDVLRERVRATSELTDEVIHQVRRISSELRPSVLDDLGLTAAIEWQAQQFEKRTGVGCLVRSTLGDTPADRHVSTALFRICQEALTNVARHARASTVRVTLTQDARALRMEVRDDGIGVPPAVADSSNRLGLLGMRERARYVGGTARVTGGKDGTRVTVEVPRRAVTRREQPT